MGMPVTLDLVDGSANDLEAAFARFVEVDEAFSTYKPQSEIERAKRGDILPPDYSDELRQILELAEQTKRESDGYFDIGPFEHCDPSGIVKGWAVRGVANLLKERGVRSFYVEAGGDIQLAGSGPAPIGWTVGIRNPFNDQEIVKSLSLTDKGVATSGTYARGEHIYNPKTGTPVTEIVGLTIIGPDIYEADRFATAAFAMGKAGISFIEHRPGLEGYMIDTEGMATYTSGFNQYVTPEQ